MPQVLFTELAEQDLEDIADYIALDNPLRAISFIGEIRDHCHQVVRAPQSYPLRANIAPDIRSCSHGRYLIFFRERSGYIVILRILHGARDVAALFEQGDI